MRQAQVARGRDKARLMEQKSVLDVARWQFHWMVEKWSPEQVSEASRISGSERVDTALLEKLGLVPLTIHIPGNILLNVGIQLIENLLIGAGGTTATNATAQIGVGNGTAAAAATQTALQGASTLYKGMLASYPARTNQTLDFRSEFIDTEAEFAWEEWAIRNDATANVLLNRKVEALGTKAAGSVWTITGSVTIT